MTFAIKIADVQYTQARRGINAVAPITIDGIAVGHLDDRAEAIVASVHFPNPLHRDTFLAAAKAWAKTRPHFAELSDLYLMSEYARAMLALAEQIHLDKRDK